MLHIEYLYQISISFMSFYIRWVFLSIYEYFWVLWVLWVFMSIYILYLHIIFTYYIYILQIIFTYYKLYLHITNYILYIYLLMLRFRRSGQSWPNCPYQQRNRASCSKANADYSAPRLWSLLSWPQAFSAFLNLSYSFLRPLSARYRTFWSRWRSSTRWSTFLKAFGSKLIILRSGFAE